MKTREKSTIKGETKISTVHPGHMRRTKREVSVMGPGPISEGQWFHLLSSHLLEMMKYASAKPEIPLRLDPKAVFMA